MLERRVRKRIVTWLITGMVMVYIMVMIGGITRLTDSGLSMMEWKPVVGVLPPMSDEAWTASFEKYKQIEQYKKLNPNMTLDEYKSIFWPEYIHRTWGRLIGIVFLVPFLIFFFKKQLRGNLKFRAAMLFVLGGMQGLMGWIMVASGFDKLTYVSHIRLMLHLILALLIMGYLVWMVTQLVYRNVRPDMYGQKTTTRKWLRAFIVVLVMQIIYGAFMAGLHAGVTYPTYPLMSGQFIPDGMFTSLDGGSWISNFVNNHALIQFIHRMLPWVLIFISIVFFIRLRKYHHMNGRARALGLTMFLILLTQIVLGILTVINCQGHVPVTLGVAHQAVGVMLFIVSLFLFYSFGKKKS